MAKKKGKKKKRNKIQRDELGEFRMETYFVGGKQKRRKIRLIEGMPQDEFIERNADPITLHQMGKWDLIDQRRLEKE